MNVVRRAQLGRVGVAVALLVGTATAPVGAGAASVPAPTGTIACSALVGRIRWAPVLTATAAAHTLTVQAVAGGCDVSWVVGGAARISSITLAGAASIASMRCSDLRNASAISVPVQVTFWGGPNGTGSTVSTATSTAQLTLSSFALSGSVSAGAFRGDRFGATNAKLAESTSALTSLCASPFGLESASFAGGIEIESPSARPVVGASVGPLESVVLTYATPGAHHFDVQRAGPYPVGGVPNPVPASDWVLFGTKTQSTYIDQMAVPGRSYVYQVHTDDLLHSASLPTRYNLPVVLQSVTPPANACRSNFPGNGIVQCDIPYGAFSHYTAKAFALDGTGKPLGPLSSFTTSWNDASDIFYLCPRDNPTLCPTAISPNSGPQPYYLNVTNGSSYDVELFYIDNTATATAFSYIHNVPFP